MSQELLESRWGETKEALLEGLQGARRSTMGGDGGGFGGDGGCGDGGCGGGGGE